MQLIAHRVGIEGPHGTLVPQTSLTVSAGEFVIVKGEPGTGITAFGLALAGRLRPSTGTVTVHDSPAAGTSSAVDDRRNTSEAEDAPSVDDESGETADSTTATDTDARTEAAEEDAAADEDEGGPERSLDAERPAGSGPITAAESVRRRVAVVDSPGVSEPDEALSLRVVVGEELAFAGRRANRAAVTRWLSEHDVASYADSRFERLDADLRTRVLVALAASRDGVRMLVLDRPDRHTSETDAWVRLARAQAERGLAVVVLTATAADTALLADVVRIGHPDPTHPLPEAHS